MKTQFRKSVEKYCLTNAETVHARIDQTVKKLHAFTNGNGPVASVSSIAEGVGKFGGRTMDTDRLSQVIGSIKTSQVKDDAKDKDAVHCAALFDKYKSDHKYFKPLYLTTDKSVVEIKTLCSEYMNQYVDLFRAFRQSDLLLNRKYNPDVHDGSLKKLSWQTLKSDELKQIPPVIVELSTTKIDGNLTATIQDILTAGIPVKMAVFLKHTENIKKLTGRETALNVNPSPGFQALFLRGVYICQISLASQNADSFDQAVAGALISNRPAMLSLLDAPADEALLANTSRSFIHLKYDPDASASFQKCIDISDNPDLENNWGYDEEGFDFSPAHYLKKTGRFDSEFEDGSNLTDKISIKDFFGSSKSGTPVIVSDTREYKMSNGVISYCSNHIDNWNTLRSLAGIDNPQLTEAIAETKAVARSEKKAELDKLKTELVQKYESVQQQSMKTVMKKLVMNLLSAAENGNPGISLVSLEANSIGSDISEPKDEAPIDMNSNADSGANEEPWIETDMCTACDECITINSSIFEYNEDKLAVIKNPVGGPYRDIVKAAEKCSAGIIHPGLPLKAGEKDSEKWIKRAAKYN